MPFCPQCRLEYRLGFTICSDCQKALVETLPEIPPQEPADPDDSQDWVPLAKFGTQVYAAMIEDGFKILGIPVTVLSGTGHFGRIGLMGAVPLPIEGSYTILVRPEHAQRADEEGYAMLGELWDKSRLTPESGTE